MPLLDLLGTTETLYRPLEMALGRAETMLGGKTRNLGEAGHHLRRYCLWRRVRLEEDDGEMRRIALIDRIQGNKDRLEREREREKMAVGGSFVWNTMSDNRTLFEKHPNRMFEGARAASGTAAGLGKVITPTTSLDHWFLDGERSRRWKKRGFCQVTVRETILIKARLTTNFWDNGRG
jgi:hypothetical protein